MAQQEEWLQIMEHPGYEVSNLGRVRSYRQLNNDGGPRVLRPGASKKGHQSVSLRGKMRLVHQLVLEAFVSARPPGLLALHRDGDPANNCIENLYWGTYSDNLNDSVRHGTHPAASKTHCKHGHELSVRGNGFRYCKQCNNESSRRSKMRTVK